MKKIISILLLSGCSTPPHIERDQIESAIRNKRDEFLYCYEREVNADKSKNFAGKVILEWIIGANGFARDIKVANSSLKNANVERCVMFVVSRIQFPAANPPVTIRYPFTFRRDK